MSPAILLLLTLAARAELPLPLYPACGEPDQPELCPSDLGEAWDMLSYVPERYRDTVREAEWAMGSGLGADRAWRTSTGSTAIVVAVLDSGIKWDNERLLEKHWLNVAELPLPQLADGSEAPDYDVDGNGVVNIRDYADDPRVDIAAGDDAADALLDPSDLIWTFSDGVDDDGNGFVDDIAGWDFMWNDNDPYDDTRYGHGTGESEDSCQGGEDGGGIGPCPNCMLVNLRVSDSYLADASSFGAAVLYGTDLGVAVLQEALGSFNNATFVQEAIDVAWDRGVLVVASAADETSYHQNAPGFNAHTLFVHAIRYDTDSRDDATTFLAYSNCTNHGARLDLSAPATHCSSGATGITAGVAGLLYSTALEHQIALTANEARQLLVTTADDIDVEGSASNPDIYPSQPGWDRYFGQGRVNAWRAVEALVAGDIPPETDIASPAWFELLDPTVTPQVEVHGLARADRDAVASWLLEVAVGLEPLEEEFSQVASGSGEAEGLLGTLDLSALALDPEALVAPYTVDDDQVAREDAVNLHTVTLRLRVTDSQGREGHMRRVVYVHHDPDALPGFPLRLGSSLEASPVLYDLDGDGALDIIQADSAGALHVLRADGTELPGFPVDTAPLEELDPEHPDNHLDNPLFSAFSGAVGGTIVGTPAVGDLDGDGQAEIVLGTARGHLYVFEPDGSLRAGFPVQQDPVDYTDPDNILDEGFFASPALGDLDGDGDLEIIAAGMDQLVYAWHHDATEVAGWPVLAIHPDWTDHGARIVSSPAVGDLDGDGRDDVVISTNERLDGDDALVYAISGTGVYFPGWPVDLYCPENEILPYVGEGLPVSPALGDFDEDGLVEPVTHAMIGYETVLDLDGSELLFTYKSRSFYGDNSNVSDSMILPFVNSPSLGDLTGDGIPDVVSGGAGFGYLEGMEDDGHRIAHDHAVCAWDGRDGDFLEGFPQQIEDLQFFMNPAIADITGDGAMEVIAGSGGFMLHAWDEQGVEPAGWPKFTGQWVLASPAVGDIDGDGLYEVVVGTRSGWLFAWDTPAPVGSPAAWPMFGHDALNTRDVTTPLPDYAAPVDISEEEEGGCGCGAPGAILGLWPLGVLLAWRRRRP
ncbi:MAG: FG-GAP-like repeat-containing protein [Pseudomonadota bacterium]